MPLALKLLTLPVKAVPVNPPERTKKASSQNLVIGFLLAILLVGGILGGLAIWRTTGDNTQQGGKSYDSVVFNDASQFVVTTTPTDAAKPIDEEPPAKPAVKKPKKNNRYLYPSNTRYITRQYLSGLSRQKVVLIRNEIYARHGYMFKMREFRRYFRKKSWYYPNPYFSERLFSRIEKKNIQTIVGYEKSRGWR